MKTTHEQIKEHYAALSPGQKKAASFYMDHPQEAALLTAFEIGKRAGVSETTVIRLAYALGFSGYAELQRSLRSEWLPARTDSEGVTANYDNDDDRLIQQTIHQERQILQQLGEQTKAADIEAAADLLIRADHIYIGGFGSSHAAAHWLFYALKQIRNNVQISSPEGFMTEDLCDLTEHSTAVIFSFPRYRQEPVQALQIAKKTGAHTIAFTDRPLSPAGQLADTTFTSVRSSGADTHSIVSILVIADILLAAIRNRDDGQMAARQQRLERLYAEQEVFFE